jgi:hypothetical protein
MVPSVNSRIDPRVILVSSPRARDASPARLDDPADQRFLIGLGRVMERNIGRLRVKSRVDFKK